MNQRKAKELRKASYRFAAEYLKTILPEDEAELVNPISVKAFEADQEKHIHDGESVRVAPYSSRWFYLKLKKQQYSQGKLDLRVFARELG